MILYEGRDAAGKGGTIRAITNGEPAHISGCGPAAPSDQKKREMFMQMLIMQRYFERFPAAGEIVIFDRSWYNRAGVEHVMGFCTPEEYARFLQLCPLVEKYIVDGGIQLIKLWLEVANSSRTPLSGSNQRPAAAMETQPHGP